MKTGRYENATTISTVSPVTATQSVGAGKLYIFPKHQVAASSRIHRQRWEQAEHIEEFIMLARLKALSDESKSKVKRLVNDLYAREVEERKLRDMAKSRKLLGQVWDNPSDAEYNNL